MRLIPIESVKPKTVLGKTLYDIEGRVFIESWSSFERNDY